MVKKAIISRMSFAGHPLHPMLVHFPVAALLLLIAADLTYIFTRDLFFARAGLWLAGIGSLSGAFASLIGLVDLISVARIRGLITAWCHALFAVMMLSLATFNWLLRMQEMGDAIYPWGIMISFLTTVMILLTSYMGGELVYEYGVGVDIES